MTKELIEANNDEVICPNCVTQFRAIPVNVQNELRKQDDAIERLELEQEREIVTMRERIKSLKRCIGDFEGTTRENIELRAELEKIKVQRDALAKALHGWAIGNAPGAQPAPMTNLERMKAANSRGLIESVGLWEAFEFGISDAEAHHKIKAMLEAAKEQS